MPSPNELPSSKKLIKSTIIAIIVAIILTVTVVFPSEYGKDPTGIGSILGLTKMGEIKQSLAAEVAQEQAQTSDIAKEPEPVAVVENAVTKGDENQAERIDTTIFDLAPDEGIEIKLDMKKGAVVHYSWATNNGNKVNYDIHGDSKELNIDYHRYSKGSKANDQGIIKAEFDGSHGHFWRNRSGTSVSITFETKGEYLEIKKVK